MCPGTWSKAEIFRPVKKKWMGTGGQGHATRRQGAAGTPKKVLLGESGGDWSAGEQAGKKKKKG